MHKEKDENGMLSHLHHHDAYRSRELGAFEHGLLEGDMFLQVSKNINNYASSSCVFFYNLILRLYNMREFLSLLFWYFHYKRTCMNFTLVLVKSKKKSFRELDSKEGK